MSSYVLTPLAKSDIFEIWRMIAADSEQAADRVERAIYETCAFVAESPMRGHTQPEAVGLPLRYWTLTRFRNYTVVYKPESSPLEIVAVMQGKRNYRWILKQRG
jgi:plasmid stabilization system protein ParE